MHTDQLEGFLPRLLDEIADERTPDYYTDLFRQTARTSQRPAWTFPERWLPMLEIARQPVVPQVPWRPLAILALLVGLLAVSLVLAATRPKPPPPFGPAGNGLIVMSRDGDILTVDPRTGATVAIVTGPEVDSDPMWSQDGTTLLFRRASPDVPEADFLMIARANGSGVRSLTAEPMTGLTSAKVSPTLSLKLHYALSPDGRTVAMISTVKGIPALFVAGTDGRPITKLEIGAIPLSFAFDPTGQTILFVGAQGFDAFYSGLYTIGIDGSNPQTLVKPTLDAQVHSRIAWSPDGSRIAYARFEPGTVASDRGGVAARNDLRIHVMNADGTGDLAIGEEDGPWWEAPTAWSPDGHRLLIERSFGETYGAAIMDIDWPTDDVVPPFRSLNDWYAAWSPDGTTILATPGDGLGNGSHQELWDARTSGSRPAPWTAASFPSWQRIGLP